MTTTLNEALNLAHRYDEGGTFRLYVHRRLALVIPVLGLVFVASLACTVGTIVFFVGKHFFLTLLAFLLVPLVLFGSLLVQAYVFFSWLEGRALARALGHRAPQTKNMGPLPPVPWLWAALLLLAPLSLLASVVWQAAMALVVLGLLAPILFARLDR
jgi:hypothetical protein